MIDANPEEGQDEKTEDELKMEDAILGDGEELLLNTLEQEDSVKDEGVGEKKLETDEKLVEETNVTIVDQSKVEEEKNNKAEEEEDKHEEEIESEIRNEIKPQDEDEV